MPLMAVAIIYLVMVMIFSKLVSMLEKEVKETVTTNGDVLIRVENLQKVFGDFRALNGITEEIHKGEVVVIIGPSGSGKSTFLRSLNLLEVPTGGHIYFEGVDITDAKVDIDKHRQKMGMVIPAL